MSFPKDRMIVWVEVGAEGDVVGARFHGIDHAVENLHHDVFVLSSAYTGDLRPVYGCGDRCAPTEGPAAPDPA